MFALLFIEKYHICVFSVNQICLLTQWLHLNAIFFRFLKVCLSIPYAYSQFIYLYNYYKNDIVGNYFSNGA